MHKRKNSLQVTLTGYKNNHEGRLDATREIVEYVIYVHASATIAVTEFF